MGAPVCLGPQRASGMGRLRAKAGPTQTKATPSLAPLSRADLLRPVGPSWRAEPRWGQHPHPWVQQLEAVHPGTRLRAGSSGTREAGVQDGMGQASPDGCQLPLQGLQAPAWGRGYPGLPGPGQRHRTPAVWPWAGDSPNIMQAVVQGPCRGREAAVQAAPSPARSEGRAPSLTGTRLLL